MPEKIKQVLVLRTDLKCRKGKMCVQAAHASMMWLTDRLIEDGPSSRDGARVATELTAVEHQWVRGIFTKICVGVGSEEELFAVHAAAEAAGVISRLVQDVGLTEFKGPTYTACGIGPDTAERIDPITSHLPLL